MRIFDRTELPTIGMTTMRVRHLRTNTELDLDFYVTERDEPIIGIDACRQLDMLRIVEDNICYAR